jgi:hypothetical protein
MNPAARCQNAAGARLKSDRPPMTDATVIRLASRVK